MSDIIEAQGGDVDTMQLSELNRPARASVRLGWRGARFQADAEITPIGLLAIGGMVGMILLGVGQIVRAARR